MESNNCRWVFIRSEFQLFCSFLIRRKHVQNIVHDTCTCATVYRDWVERVGVFLSKEQVAPIVIGGSLYNISRTTCFIRFISNRYIGLFALPVMRHYFPSKWWIKQMYVRMYVQLYFTSPGQFVRHLRMRYWRHNKYLLVKANAINHTVLDTCSHHSWTYDKHYMTNYELWFV